MKNTEVVARYRMAVMEAESIAVQIERLGKISQQDGAEKLREYQEQLRDKVDRIGGMCCRFEKIIAGVKRDRERVILRMYYADGMTDQEIGERLGMDTRTINVMRNEAFRRLDNKNP